MFRSSVEEFGTKDSNGDKDLIYYNIDIINNSSGSTNNYKDMPVVTFQESRSVPLINDVRNFEFSVIRFQVNGGNKNLPLWLPNIQLGQSDPNLTTYSLGFYFTNGTKSTYQSETMQFVTEQLIYTPSSAGYPKAPLTTQDFSSDYYFVYTFDHFVTLFNNTITTAWNKVIAAMTAQSVTITTKPPFMVFDDINVLFSIYYDTNGFGDADARSATEKAFLYLDTNLIGLLASFDSVNIDPSTITTTDSSINTLQSNRMNVFNKLNTNIYIPPTPSVSPAFKTLAAAYYLMLQNYTNTSTLWSPISSIAITSNSLPVHNENTSTPIIYGNSNVSNITSSTSNFSTIVADVALNTRTADAYCNFIYYEPTAEYKMSSMMGGSNQKLTNIDLQLYWKNRLDNNLYPLRMYNYSNVSLKLLFRKKKNI
jgi:hypothetical protein